MYRETNWTREIEDKYKSAIANAFVLVGNIGDYAQDTMKISTHLALFLDKQLGMDEVATFDIVNGSEFIKKDKNRKVESADGENIITICQRIQDEKSKIAYIISYPSLIVPSDSRGLNESEKLNLINLHKALTSVEFMNSKNVVIFLTESIKDMHSMLISSNTKTYVVDITLPDETKRLEFINYNDFDTSDYKREISKNEFGKLTAGLTLINIEDIILQADSEMVMTRKMILDRKKELIKKEYSEIIELYDTEGYSLATFAGQEHIKSYFQDMVIDAIKDGNEKIVPKGVLLMGPPGTGKTYFSRCLAGDAGINFVEFKMSKILNKWVGEAEKNLERAFSVFRALAPVGVFIDEIDQALSRGENDSNSVNKNLFGMFLSELSKSENRGKIVWLGATNFPNKIDEALKRPGRFDKKIPFFAPTKEERSEVFKIHLKNAGYKLAKDINTLELADKTNGYTQAEIENIAVKALELTLRRKSPEITMGILNDALEFMLSSQNNKIKEMEDIALLECNDIEFLNLEYRERQRKLFSQQKNT